jgi:hypothetical protein
LNTNASSSSSNNNNTIKGSPVSLNKEIPHVYKVLLCQMGIGRAYPIPSEQLTDAELPVGYDSFYITNGEQVHKEKELKNSLNSLKSTLGDARTDNIEKDYQHHYFLKDACQILPRYLITFEFDAKKESKSRESAKCDNCEKAKATLYCSADVANLCSACDTVLHSSKLSSRHVRTPIGKGHDVFGYCRHHPEKLIEFFCSQCHIPVCVFCKMVGNHSNGETSKHQLISVNEAYQSVLLESQSVRSFL